MIRDITKFQDAFSQADSADDFSKIAAYYQRFYMQERVLVKVDRASMLSGLEVRSPFLDHGVVEFANSLNPRVKMKNFRTKHILKSLMQSRLPRHIIERQKKGFAIPLGDWFQAELKDVLMELLSERSRVDESGIINYPYVMKLVEEHNRGRANHGQKLWSILAYLTWHRNFC
ncbi:MAG: hypothetical protein HY001_02835 [Candidatus Portnoybacteria bacterium]|nr:hypothetical protein [Candidatus Portnoybacteria bacterium]